jgi:hypothetical protein
LEELTHKIHVPARVRDKVHATKQTVQVKTEEVKQQPQTNAEETKQQPATNAEETKQQIYECPEVLHTQAEGVAPQVMRLTHQVLEELPPPVAVRTEPHTTTARQWPLPALAAAVGMLLVLLLVLRRLLCRKW